MPEVNDAGVALTDRYITREEFKDEIRYIKSEFGRELKDSLKDLKFPWAAVISTITATVAGSWILVGSLITASVKPVEMQVQDVKRNSEKIDSRVRDLERAGHRFNPTP